MWYIVDNIEKDNIFRCYTLDYLGKYRFYEEEEFVDVVKDGEYILENLKESNSFDYNNASYTFTKFGNISEGITENNVNLEIEKDNINVKFNGETTHLDLIYKMEIKELEDHYRVATRISEKGGNISTLLYINLKDKDDCLNALEAVRDYQEELKNTSKWFICKLNKRINITKTILDILICLYYFKDFYILIYDFIKI